MLLAMMKAIISGPHGRIILHSLVVIATIAEERDLKASAFTHNSNDIFIGSHYRFDETVDPLELGWNYRISGEGCYNSVLSVLAQLVRSRKENNLKRIVR